MTATSPRVRPFDDRLWRVVDTEAPPERLAMLRILVGAFTLGYLLVRLPAFLQLRDRRSGFDGVGLAVLLDEPLPGVVVLAVIAATLVSAIGFTAGWRFRISGPTAAIGMLALGSYRGSWGQLLHFEHLIVLHLAIVALAPSADVWSLDARRRLRRPDAIERVARRDATSYGWPVALAALVVVITYVIAGIAKLRYGGLEWMLGDTLRNHVAYAAARLDLLGGDPSPLAAWAVRIDGWWPIAAVIAVVIELAAPLALAGGRIRTLWVAATWTMHVGILALMLVGFAYPLSLVAFAPFFRVERLWLERPSWTRRGARQPEVAPSEA